MRIALVHRDLHASTRGGIGTVYRTLAERYVSAGHQVIFITQNALQPLQLPGTTTIVLPRTENLVHHRLSVSNALENLDVDVAECSTWEAELLTYLKLDNRCPVVVRGDLSASTMGTSQALIEAEAAIVTAADRLIAVSHFAAQDLSTAYNIPIPLVILNGVDKTQFLPGIVQSPSSGSIITLDEHGNVTAAKPIVTSSVLPAPWKKSPGKKAILWVGKVTRMKGWDRLVALSHELANDASITVVLGHSPAFCPVGNTSKLTIVQDLSTADLAGAYRAADWLLSTSRWEGFGLAIAESIACGTPVLLPSELGTSTELLTSGGGYTYENTDQIINAFRVPPSPVVLPESLDWDSNATRSLMLYQELCSR